MYCITEQQIEYILNDIRRNGVEMEDLQLNLLDHICCIVEQELKENDDFERFYHKTIRQFYKNELREIEVETINLLTFKNYYAMKKAMVMSGAMSVIAFILGSTFKIMYWPGAAVLFLLGIVLFSFIFLPLVCVLKVRETNATRNKLLLLVGTITGILYCLSALFKVMHWPGANIMWFVTLAITFFVILPAYLFTGIRQPETKMNTIVSVILIVALMSVQFLLTSIRPNTQGEMYTYLQSEQLLQKMQPIGDVVKSNTEEYRLIMDIQATCNQIKGMILQKAIGRTTIPADFEAQKIIVKKDGLGNEFYTVGGKGYKLVEALKIKVARYNTLKPKDSGQTIPVERSILDDNFFNREFCSNLFVLNNIAQLQLYLANAEQQFIAIN